MAVSVNKTSFTKSKFRAGKNEENKIKTLKITAMLFNFVFLCLFWRFVPRESGANRYFENKHTRG